MSKQFIALFCRFYLSFALSSFISPPKNTWSYFEKKKTGTIFCRSFHISCTFSFRMAHGNRRKWALLSCSVYFVRNSSAFRANFFLHQCNKIYRLTSKRLLFWCYSPCSEDSEKDSCSNKIKTTCYNWFLLFASHAGIEKDTVDWWSRLFLLYNSSRCLVMCNVLALANNFMFCKSMVMKYLCWNVNAVVHN